jgi:hypothetical protein
MSTLEEIAPAFVAMAHQIVWATAATTDTAGRPASRIVHPIWEWDGSQLTGWIATSPLSPKAGQLARVPSLSVTYWAPNHDTCTADCDTSWDDTPELRRAGWDRFVSAPPPVGYDPAIVPAWTSPDAEAFGMLRLQPRRLRLRSGAEMMAGRAPRTWRGG